MESCLKIFGGLQIIERKRGKLDKFYYSISHKLNLLFAKK